MYIQSCNNRGITFPLCQKFPVWVQSLPSTPAPGRILSLKFAFAKTSYKWDHTLRHFCFWFFSLSTVYPILIQASEHINSLFCFTASGTSLYRYTIICLFIYQLMDIWGASSLSYYEYCCYKHPQTCFCGDMFSCPWGKSIGVGFLSWKMTTYHLC